MRKCGARIGRILLMCLACGCAVSAQMVRIQTDYGTFEMPSRCKWSGGFREDSYIGSMRCRGLPEIKVDIGLMAGDYCSQVENIARQDGRPGAGCRTCEHIRGDMWGEIHTVIASCPSVNFFADVRPKDDVRVIREQLFQMATSFRYKWETE
jgi:hypothetical protein